MGADPFTIAGIVLTGVQAVGQFAQGRAQASAAEFNAQQADIDAQNAQLRAGESEERIREDNRQRIATASARRGASGIAQEGTALEVLSDAAAAGELRALDARYGGLMEANYYRDQAALERSQASRYRSDALFGAAGTLIGGGLQYGRSLVGKASGGLGSSGFVQSQQTYAAGVRGRTPF